MGLFDTKKSVSVSSVVYNLAGDVDKRPDYLKTAVVGSVMSKSAGSIGEKLTNAYLKGPGIKLRSFGNWAYNHGYAALVGMDRGSLTTGSRLNRDTLAALIPHNPNEFVELQTSRIGVADYTFWVDQFMLANYPTLLNTNYRTDYDPPSNLIIITFADGNFTIFTPLGYNASALYLYASYTLAVTTVQNGKNVTTHTPLRLLIYAQGTGNPGFDAFFGGSAEQGDYFPYIPFRINNQRVGEQFLGDVYPVAKKAFKRSVGGDFDDVIRKIEENPSVGDIDYAYVAFGASLNAKDDAAKKYIYNFFQEIMLADTGSYGQYQKWRADWRAAEASIQAYNFWSQYYNQGDVNLIPAPEKLPFPSSPPSYNIVIAGGNRPDINFLMDISWNGIQESVGSGLKKPGAKVGELWFEQLGAEEFNGGQYSWGSEFTLFDNYLIEHVRLCWQITASTWRAVDLYGLSHRNFIYQGKSVDITAMQALNDPSESGFIIPLHTGIFKRMSLVDSTQICGSCCYMVFNCYQVVKQKWYQTGWFKVLLIVAVIVIAVATAGAGLGPSVGLLGAASEVGAALGFTGTVAIIAGTLANTLAAIILTQIITTASTAFFGDKIGAIVGVLASVIALQVGTSIAAGGSISTAFSSLMDPQSILKLTMSAGNGYNGYLNAGTQDTIKQTQALANDYTTQSAEIAAKTKEVLGQSESVIDPMSLTDVSRPSIGESPESFLSRTLLSGSDIAEMSIGMLGNMSSITLSTELS